MAESQQERHTGGLEGDTVREGRDLDTREVAPGRADPGRRVVAGLIDAGLAIVVGFIPLIGGLLAAAYWLTRDGLDFEFMHRRSLGKAVMKLEPVRLSGGPIDLETSFRRNWMFALGGLVSLLLFIPIIGWVLAIPVGLAAFVIGVVELYLVLTSDSGRRWGDKLADTQVLESESA